MSTTQLERRTIERTERLTNSVNGNPRFRFYFTDGSVADLSSDASFGYEAENPEYRPGRTVDVCFTRAGRVEYMKPVATDRFKVSVFPVYEDGDSGDLCAYSEMGSLWAAMERAGHDAEKWLVASPESGEAERQPVRFSVEVEL